MCYLSTVRRRSAALKTRIKRCATLSPFNHNMARNGGFALLVVLWGIALIVLIVSHIASSSQMEVLIARNIRTSTVAEAAADGAANHAIFLYLAHQWAADGVTHLVRGVQAVSEVRIENEDARIDPNVAPSVLIAALLRICGATPRQAERLAVAISEWRSVDVLRPFGGEQAPQYSAAGLPYRPPNKRFVSKDELGLVIGMTPELLSCIRPHISVYSLSVPSLQRTSDQVVRRALMEAYPDDRVGPAQFTPEAAVIRVSAAAQAAGGKFLRVGIVRIAVPDNERTPFEIVSWERVAD
jgi:general secretion pathway protein K